MLRSVFCRLPAHTSYCPPNTPLHRHLAMAASDWITMPQHGTIPPYSVFSKPIEKSLSDQRHYRIIRLENGLTAMVVHDPKTENAAASLDVGVGHLSDPVSGSLLPTIPSYSYRIFSRKTCQVWHTFASTYYSWYAQRSLPWCISSKTSPGHTTISQGK